MKEIRVYVVNAELYDGEKWIQELSNKEFIAIAEEQGTIYSLKGFENDYNDDCVDTINTFIRFIKVESERGDVFSGIDSDLYNCIADLDERSEPLSSVESAAAYKLYELCKEFVDTFDALDSSGGINV